MRLRLSQRPAGCRSVALATPWRAIARGALLLLVCGWLGASPAQAQSMAQAQAAYSEGFDLYKKRKFTQATKYFSKALKLAPQGRKYRRFRSAMHFFVGMCHYRRRRWSSAQRHLKTFLRMGGGSARFRAEAKGALRVASARLAAARRSQRRPVRRRTTVVTAPNVRYQPPRRATPRPAPRPATPTPPPTRRPQIAPHPATPTRKAPGVAPQRSPRVTRATTGRPPPPPATGGPHPVSYALIGIGGAALVTAGVLIGVAQAQQNSAMALFEQHQSTPDQSKPSAKEVIEPLNQARTMSYVSYGLVAGGAALGVVGVVVLLTLRRPAPPPPATDSTRVRIQMAIFP